MIKNKIQATVSIILLSFIFTNLACLENHNTMTSSKGENFVLSSTPAGSSTADEKIDRLRSILPLKPTVVGDVDVLRIMREAGETKLPVALNLLIDSLAFNYDPDNRNENDKQSEMIPAIAMIKEYFGERALEVLYKRGVSTEKDWLADRVALTIRTNFPSTLLDDFASRSEPDPNNARSRYFLVALTKSKLQVILASRQDSSDEIDKIIEKKQKELKQN